MGCSLLLRPGGDAAFFGADGAPALDYDAAGAVNGGSLCAKGNMVLELLIHPQRLEAPAVRRADECRPVAWDAALDLLRERLLALVRDHGPESIGIVVGPHLTVEEARLAARLARTLCTGNLDACLAEDRALLSGPEAAGALPAAVRSPREIAEMTALLLVGDLFTVAPCMAKCVLDARYERRQNLLSVLDATRTRTAWFGRPWLRCRPGREAAALALLLLLALERSPEAGSRWRAVLLDSLGRASTQDLADLAALEVAAVEPVASALLGEKRSGVIVSPAFAGRERDVLVSGLAALLAEATGSHLLLMPSGPNARGVHEALAAEGFPAPGGLTTAEMFEAAATGELKGLLVLGSDPFAALASALPRVAALNLRLLAVTAPLPGETTLAADVVLPAAAWAEKDGSVQNAFGEDVELVPALPPPGAARSEAWILDALLARLGTGPGPAAAGISWPAPRVPADLWFEELRAWLRRLRRAPVVPEAGSHLLLPRLLAPHAADGWLTRRFSWPRHEFPHLQLWVSPAHARDLGVAEGARVTVRSRDGSARMLLHVEPRVTEGVVQASSSHPEVRGLLRWRIDPVLRDLDLSPVRVNVEVAGGSDG